jgi:hypothetical protein
MSNGYITADFDTLMRQGPMTASLYLAKAIDDVNAQLGKDAARKHPEIVTAFVQAATIDAVGGVIAQQIRADLDAIAAAIESRTDRTVQIRAGLDAIAAAIESHTDRTIDDGISPEFHAQLMKRNPLANNTTAEK